MQSKRDGKAQAKAEKAYRKAQRPWYKKKRFLLPLLFLLLIIGIAAVSSGGDTDPGTSGSSSQQDDQAADPADEPAAEEEAEPADEPAPEEPAFPGATDDDVIGQAGDELTLGDITITAAALESGDDTLGATICTRVSMTNGAEETVDFNAFDWSLQQPSGTITTTSFSGSDDQLPSGQIAPGGSAEGDVCFDGELAEGQSVVLYEPILSFFSDRGAWINER